ncbi:MAG: PrsW family intramembrane metalloprotease [Butyrivibrio sp.]|nr:PrsW family intramembrane metalloprotease [Butyrivibrio sp.]
MNSVIYLTVLPPLFLLGYIYKIDKIEHEPVKLILKLFVLGVLSCFPAVVLEDLGVSLLYSISSNPESTVTIFIENFFVIALAEEGLKFLFTYQGSWRHKEFNYRFDAIVYAVAVSIGFALLENILYVFTGDGDSFSIVVQRALTSIPLHTITAIFMGHFYGEAKLAYHRGNLRKSKRGLRLALIVPVIIHGFYDFCLSVESDLLILIFFVYIIVLDIVAFIKVRKYAKEDVAI